MKATAIRIAAPAVLILSLILWMYGGAQAGFYRTYYQVQKVDEITGIEYSEKVNALLPGIETLFLGFLAFIALSGFNAWLENKNQKQTSV